MSERVRGARALPLFLTMADEEVNKMCGGGGARRRRRRIWTKMRWKYEVQVEEAEEEYLGTTGRAPTSFNQTSKSATRLFLLMAAIVAFQVRWNEHDPFCFLHHRQA